VFSSGKWGSCRWDQCGCRWG